MKWHMTLCTLLVMGFATLAAVSAEPSRAEVFNKLVARAKANLDTPVGREYDRVFSKHFEEHSGEAVKACFESTANPNTSRFEMVFTVHKNGKLLEVSVWPETNIGLCLQGKMAGATVPPPPADGYLAYMEMKFQP